MQLQRVPQADRVFDGPRDEYTHWKQTVFYLHNYLTVSAGDDHREDNVQANATNPARPGHTLAYQRRPHEVVDEQHAYKPVMRSRAVHFREKKKRGGGIKKKRERAGNKIHMSTLFLSFESFLLLLLPPFSPPPPPPPPPRTQTQTPTTTPAHARSSVGASPVARRFPHARHSEAPSSPPNPCSFVGRAQQIRVARLRKVVQQAVGRRHALDALLRVHPR